MPRVKLDYVVSFSSEDSENRASNLLAHEVSKKKWLCSAGESSCSVVLQLARSVQIATVHIGAYHAALVEVLVGRSEKPNDPFEVLVPSSVFLSPLESRRGEAVERVRSFASPQLGAARAGRWDRLRVVCSQPYNKHCKYGLSFIHIFDPEDRPEPAVPRRLMAVDAFSSDEEEFRPGELFAKHQQRVSAGSADTGAQIRQATSQALKNISDSATKLVKTPISKTTNRPDQSQKINTNRQKDSLMYTDEDELPHSKIDAIVQRHKDDKELESKKEPPKKDKTKEGKESKLANSSRSFRDFIDDDINGKDLNTKPKEKTSKDDKRKDLDSSRSKDSSKDDRRKDLNGSRSKDNSKDDRRNNDDGRTSLKKTDDSAQNRDSKKRPHPDDKQKNKAPESLRPGPVSAAPHTLLAGVVFALSGYENPRRARLRAAAAALGARFERDWSAACTHLVCAFPNTPKLRSVRAARSDCIAVTGEWVEGCCEHRRLLPWQWFATESRCRVPAPASWAEEGDDTECDTDDEIEKVLRKQKRQRIDDSPSPPQKSPKPHTSKEKSPKPDSSREKSTKPHSSREKSPKPHSNREKSPKPHSSRDTSPKAHKNKEKAPESHTNKEAIPKGSSQNSSNISRSSDVVFLKDERIQGNITIDSGEETDEEKPVLKEKVDKKSVLPDFFEGYTFVIDGDVEAAGFDAALLRRYVTAYGGVVVDASQVDSDSDISYVLAAGGAGSRRVRADWVWRCHQQRALCDAAEFAL